MIKKKGKRKIISKEQEIGMQANIQNNVCHWAGAGTMLVEKKRVNSKVCQENYAAGGNRQAANS